MIVMLGAKLHSTVCSTEVVAIRASGGELALECGGRPMVGADGPPPSGAPDDAWADGSLLGKRYVDAGDAIEVLCTRGGAGTLGVGGVRLEVKPAKLLPASD
jgi:hypothetical protein